MHKCKWQKHSRTEGTNWRAMKLSSLTEIKLLIFVQPPCVFGGGDKNYLLEKKEICGTVGILWLHKFPLMGRERVTGLTTGN